VRDAFAGEEIKFREAVTTVTRKQLLIVRSVLAVVTAAAVLGLVAVVGWTFGFGVSSQRTFDSADWRAWGDERACDSDSPRLEMVQDLRTNTLRLGMSRAKVIRLLGPQDDPDGLPRSLEYGLGGVIDCEFLSLDFDKRGRLTRIERYQG